MTAPEPAFEAPWHARLFALTVELNEAGHFAWSDWATAFGETLQRHGLTRELDGGDDYFLAWLETLEQFLKQRDVTDPTELKAVREGWERAYLHTPHGAPVRFEL